MNHLIFCTFVTSVLAVSARGNIISNLSFDSATNLYTYSYEIRNGGTAAIIGLGLDLFAPIVGTTSPVGWDVSIVPLGPETLVQWVSLDIPFDVPPSGALSGFSIISPSGPGTVEFSVLNDIFDSEIGQTIGPTAVPEPTTQLGVIAGLLLIAFVRRSTTWAL